MGGECSWENNAEKSEKKKEILQMKNEKSYKWKMINGVHIFEKENYNT